ncbi:hypothetical protein [Leisingera sp. JC1]|uniref:hypothetical protein n=1 Tax=Leisingera sp. JC1 TaxID=1855282 RepID=UPI001131AEC9|nr:hypothetical protein [Leisingera sp. JC1]
MRKLVAVAFALSVGAGAGCATGEPDYNLVGKQAFSLWECAALSGVARDDSPEALNLFDNGYKLMREFVVAWKEGKLTKENTNEVPIGISWRLTSGPSVDFSLGYMWSEFARDAFDDTWDDSIEATFDEKKQLQILKAEQQFRDRNCELLEEVIGK